VGFVDTHSSAVMILIVGNLQEILVKIILIRFAVVLTKEVYGQNAKVY
jgi:hypothetical protein